MLLDFASTRELTAQIGHAPPMWPRVAVKELIDNALDICEQIRSPPRIEVRIDHKVIEVADNGPGIPPEIIPDILDFMIRVSSREAFAGPWRGAQGLGLKTLVVMPFVLSGKAGQIEIETHGIKHVLTVALDPIAQTPLITVVGREPSLVQNGSLVRIRWPDSASLILANAIPAIWSDLYKTAVFNPHLALPSTPSLAGVPNEYAWEATNPDCSGGGRAIRHRHIGTMCRGSGA